MSIDVATGLTECEETIKRLDRIIALLEDLAARGIQPVAVIRAPADPVYGDVGEVDAK